eukprot:355719_1
MRELQVILHSKRLDTAQMMLLLASRSLLHVFYPHKEVNKNVKNRVYISDKEKMKQYNLWEHKTFGNHPLSKADFPWLDSDKFVEIQRNSCNQQMVTVEEYKIGVWVYNFAILYEVMVNHFKVHANNFDVLYEYGFFQW